MQPKDGKIEICFCIEWVAICFRKTHDNQNSLKVENKRELLENIELLIESTSQNLIDRSNINFKNKVLCSFSIKTAL